LFFSIWQNFGIATGYELNDRGMRVQVPAGRRILTSRDRPDRVWDSPSLLANGYRGLLQVIKRQGLEADHSIPTNEVKKTWNYTATPPYAAFMT
jgi:hypothetical protein